MIYKTTDKTSPTALIGVTETAIGQIGRMVASMEFPEREGHVQNGVAIIERECGPFPDRTFVVIGWAREASSEASFYFFDGHYDLTLTEAWERFVERAGREVEREARIAA